MRNLANINYDDTLAGYQLPTGTPSNNNILIFHNGSWIYGVNGGGGSGINNTIATGSGIAVNNGIFGQDAYFRSLLSGSGITLVNNGPDISFNINNIQTLQNLILTNIANDNTAVKYLCLDAFNNVVYSNSSGGGDITDIQTVGTGASLVFGVFGNIAYLKSLGGSADFIFNILSNRIDLNLNTTLSDIRIINSGTGSTQINNILATSINNLININNNSIATPLNLNSTQIYMNNIPLLPAADYPAILFGPSGLFKANIVNNIANLGSGSGIFSSLIDSTANLKSLLGSTNINITAGVNELLFDLSSNLNNIVSINNGIGTTAIPRVISDNIKLNNIVGGTSVKTLGLNNTNDIVFLNTLNAITDINNATTGTNLNINSNNIYFPNIVNLPNPTNYLTLDNTGKLHRSTSTISTANIYNSDGQLTNTDRVIQALSPVGLNRIIFDNITLSWQNNNYYNPQNLAITGDDIIYSAPLSGDYSRALYAPYNCLSQKITYSGLGLYRDFVRFYQATCFNVNINTMSYEIEVYEDSSTNDNFSARWIVNVNTTSIIKGIDYIVSPVNSSQAPVSTSAFNMLDLAFNFDVGPITIINFKLYQTSLFAINSGYKIFVKDLTSNQKTLNLSPGAGVIGALINNQYNASLASIPYSLIVVGAPPGWLIPYVFNRNIMLSGALTYVSINNNQSATITIFINSVPFITKTIYAATNNSTVTAYFKRFLKLSDLFNAGINFGNITITTGISGVNFNPANCPQEMTCEFI